MPRTHRKTHVWGELLHSPHMVSDSQQRGNRDDERARAPTSFSSVGEDRALLLGFTMMAFSILMYLVMGFAVVQPCFHSDWGDATNCTLIQAEFLHDSTDLKGVGASHCLQVLVNVSSNRTLRLRYDEAAVDLSPECFYMPKNHQNTTALEKEAENIKDALSAWQDKAVKCHLSSWRYPDDAILTKRHVLQQALWSLVWPSLVLVGGLLLVLLVLIMQCLAQLCTEIIQDKARGDGQSVQVQGKVYRMGRRSSSSSSLEEEDESAS
ncbi:calcium-activated potassium channel subunit beta-3 [Trichomycterus rosablanca]|uniref:calcium-activated potassium channel subunit beta-3 n=1 Tax=Trichomycterus rosablanca TaxID=2290929 RepID=UPI002F35D8AE